MATRRRFIHQSGLIAAGAGLAPALWTRAGARPRRSPNAAVGVGVVGVNGMGWTNLLSLLNVPDVEAVALCDVDRNVLDRRGAELLEATGRKAALYDDYRRLLDDPAVDAVVIATPDHWHPLIMVDACRAGKDVYCEKPIANSVHEAVLMRKAAERYGRVVQVGQWQRSGPHWQAAVDYVHAGHLGNIRTVKAWAYMGWMKNVEPKPDGPPPPGVDYDFWLGPAPERPFNPNRFHFTFRWYWDYAGGLMTDWGVHLIDIVLWGMQARAPRAVLSSGGMFAYPGSAMETPDTQLAVYEFDGFTMLWEHAVGIDNGPYGRTHGVAFIGNNGTLVVDRGGWEVIPESEDGVAKVEAVPRQEQQGSDLDRHTANFIDCMRTRATPNAPIEVGEQAAVVAHLGNVAFKRGQRVVWDAAEGRFEGDRKANQLLRPHYRDPWEVPQI